MCDKGELATEFTSDSSGSNSRATEFSQRQNPLRIQLVRMSRERFVSQIQLRSEVFEETGREARQFEKIGKFEIQTQFLFWTARNYLKLKVEDQFFVGTMRNSVEDKYMNTSMRVE